VAVYSEEDLARRHTDQGFRESYARLFSIREFLEDAIVTLENRIDDKISGAICLTAEGDSLLEEAKSKFSELSDAELRLVVFQVFYHTELLVDVRATDWKALASFLSTKIRTGYALYPYIFDRTLYEKAYTTLPQHPERLSVEETAELLRDTPIGVYQIATSVVGPFGLLQSAERRFLPPRPRLRLWHCGNLSCSAVHETHLARSGDKLQTAAAKLKRELTTRDGPPSEWWEFGVNEARPERLYLDDLWAGNLPYFLANAFSEREIRKITEHVINIGGAELRANLPPENARFRAAASVIAESLSKPEALQVALLATDQQIFQSVDEAIYNREILIPDSEVRGDPTGFSARSWQEVSCECSSLGFRVVANHSGLTPLARLKRLVLNLYSGEDERKELWWALRSINGHTLGEKLEGYINTLDPVVVVSRFIFSSPEKVQGSVEQIRAQHLPVPFDQQEEQVFTQRVLWKLGFPKTSFESPLRTFYERLAKFEVTARTSYASVEQWREQVRSLGVNLFVSTEEILDQALVFCTWLFMSDHVAVKHSFNLKKGRLLTAKTISGLVSTDRGPIEYRADAKNTLFPLILGFSALRLKLESMLDESHDRYLKPKARLAFFSHKTELQLFPFLHEHFIFDAPSHDRLECLKLIGSVSDRLQSGSIMPVRNNIEHLSEPFPTGDEIDLCCKLLRSCIGELEEAGLFPVVFTTSKTASDGYRRMRVESRDYKGRLVSWFRSPALSCMHDLPSPQEPHILVPSVRLPETSEIVRFRLEEESDFTEMWRDYPKRRYKDETSE
jgi:hypothetical protein